jgi:hypothetical protein
VGHVAVKQARAGQVARLPVAQARVGAGRVQLRVGQHSRSTMSCSPRWAAQCAAEEAAGAQKGAGTGTHQESLAPPRLPRKQAEKTLVLLLSTIP